MNGLRLGLSDDDKLVAAAEAKEGELVHDAFWKRDEGIDEIQKSVKDAWNYLSFTPLFFLFTSR